MKILLDSNILISAILFDTSAIIKLIKFISEKHELYISNNIFEEIQKVIKRKKPDKLEAMNKMLNSFEFRFQYLPNEPIDDIEIRDQNDKIILSDAIRSNVDILITSDKDFFDVKYDGLEIISPYDFLKKYYK
jgi:putative PIN family toxin of toxin-antitoxin system